MKIEVEEHAGWYEVRIRRSDGIPLHCFVYKSKAEVDAFVNGFTSCKEVMNGLVQSLPVTYSK